ncbi:n-alpha-acetyltransferase 35, NatC auxiliary subunit-like [Planoprotostelium fungivorum]|uniref:N-alpha-acetyltransferase 35, NatC auxiliary subunit-like n=1 Tax=Planoprotostelium fungivorum TaxID=1890364 RepID=A0A2P6MWE1_9EUKA|nr:n-alpha-acetyltransferase 35, NatC auxiliary subunit-like [Planoprotostelium fungivorum]
MSAFERATKDIESEEWVDISSFVEEACNDFASGQLLHRTGYNLFEAMSAIEIGDPKMDSGVNLARFLSTEERIERSIIPKPDDTLPNETVIEIMDQLLCCQATWFSGFSLAQSIFTCIYLHRHTCITNQWLLPFILGLLKCCDHVRTLIMRADVFGEEDFLGYTFDFYLCGDRDDDDITSLLEDTIKRLSEKMKGPNGAVFHSIRSRVEFVSTFRGTLMALDGKLTASGTPLRTPSDYNQARTILASCRKHLDELVERKGDIPMDQIFDPQVARVQQGPAPARVISLLDFSQFKTLFSSLIDALDAVTLLPQLKSKTINSYLDYLYWFSAAEPNVIARSRMHLCVLSEGKILGKMTVDETINEGMLAFHVPPATVKKQQTQDFVVEVAKVAVHSIRVLSYNRARQRRKIVHLLDDIVIIIQYAQSLDYEYKPPTEDQEDPGARHLESWVLDLAVPFMVQFVELGFELELYHPTEYASIYWYLDYLQGFRLRNSQYVSSLVAEGESKKSKGKKKTPFVPSIDQLYTEAHMALCRGIFRMIYAMHCSFPGNVIPYSPFSTSLFPGPSSDEMRFYHRFGVFHKLTQPTPLHYNHFKETTVHDTLTVEQLIHGATECFKQAKFCIEKVVAHAKTTSIFTEPTQTPLTLSRYSTTHLQSLMKVSVTNLVQFQLLQGAKAKGEAKPLGVNFSAHGVYIVLKN